MLIYIYIIS